jgi:hypothetical protein
MSKKKSQDSSSKLTSISDLIDSGELNSLRLKVIQMEKDNVAMGQALDKALSALDKKDEEIKHLQTLLGGTAPNITTFPQTMTDEEIIALQQLEGLKIISATRDLTLEEIKKFDLLVKNKRLSQGNPTTIDAEFEKLPSNPDDLKKLASRKITVVKSND